METRIDGRRKVGYLTDIWGGGLGGYKLREVMVDVLKIIILVAVYGTVPGESRWSREL